MLSVWVLKIGIFFPFCSQGNWESTRRSTLAWYLFDLATRRLVGLTGPGRGLCQVKIQWGSLDWADKTSPRCLLCVRSSLPGPLQKLSMFLRLGELSLAPTRRTEPDQGTESLAAYQRHLGSCQPSNPSNKSLHRSNRGRILRSRHRSRQPSCPSGLSWDKPSACKWGGGDTENISGVRKITELRFMSDPPTCTFLKKEFLVAQASLELTL